MGARGEAAIWRICSPSGRFFGNTNRLGCDCYWQDCGEPRDFDRPHRAIFRVDSRGAADLFNEAPYQAEAVPLAFGFGLEPLAIVADGHGHRINVFKGVLYRHDDRSLAAGEGVVIAVSDHFRDNNPQCCHYIEIENKGLAVTRQRDGALRCSL
jgi:hypothetical protein